MDVLNTDIYELLDSVRDLQARYIPEEDQGQDTLALGIYGMMADLFATLLQNSAISTGELGNELFPARAKFERNVIDHAIIQNIEEINAVPATANAMLGIFEDDIINYSIEDKLIIDRDIIFNIENFEFHLEYDVIINKAILPNNEYTYTAMYDMTRKNTLSRITNPYLQAPFIQIYNGKPMVYFYVELIQYSKETQSKHIISNNLVENKTVVFEFEDQLADFTVKVTENNKETYLTPVFEGMGLEDQLADFCYYSYMDASHIRVRFDSISYVPRINAQIDIDIYTTRGADGNLEYTQAIFPIIYSDKYKYKKILSSLQLVSKSSGGMDRKSVDELRRMLPKEALSRGSVTCAQDLENYFNMINTEVNRLIPSKRVDNQFERSYFAYMLLKDSYNNVVPTNTINVDCTFENFDTHDNRKYVIKPGSYIVYDDRDNNIGHVSKYNEETAENLDYLQENDKTNFVYTCPFMLVVTGDPLIVSYYLTLVDTMAQTDFTYVNTNSLVQFICTNVYFYRQYKTKPDTYFMDFSIAPNIAQLESFVTYDANNQIATNKLKVFVVFFNDGNENVPYAYKEAEFVMPSSDDTNNGAVAGQIYDFRVEFTTKDILSDNNRIYVYGLTRAAASEPADSMLLSPHIGVKIYVCVNLNDDYGIFGRYDLDDIVPEGIDEYTVTNMYTVNNGLRLYENFSEVVSSQVSDIKVEGIYTDYLGFHIKNVPVIKRSYVEVESNMKEFVDNLIYKKAYIDRALYVLEDNFLIDFKFFNTYGPSRIYTMNRAGTVDQLIDRVNLTMNFELKLMQASDKTTKNQVLEDIKELVEDLNDISSLHIPNLITTITNKYREVIEYIEFLGFNDYGPGVQHLYRQEFNVITGTHDVNLVPEFLTVHTNLNDTPDINIRLA